MYCVYVIKNIEKNKIYIGQTSDLEKRLQRHNGLLKKKAKSFTNINKGVWKVIYQESLESRSQAMAREKQLKSSCGRAFIKAL